MAIRIEKSVSCDNTHMVNTTWSNGILVKRSQGRRKCGISRSSRSGTVGVLVLMMSSSRCCGCTARWRQQLIYLAVTGSEVWHLYFCLFGISVDRSIAGPTGDANDVCREREKKMSQETLMPSAMAKKSSLTQGRHHCEGHVFFLGLTVGTACTSTGRRSLLYFCTVGSRRQGRSCPCGERCRRWHGVFLRLR